MQKLAEFIVNRRRAILAVAIVLTIAAAVGTMFVTINKDLTRYLPEDSNTLQGIDAMNAEFDQTIPLRVMYTGLADNEVEAVAADLEALDDVAGVEVERGQEGTAAENKTLFTVSLEGGTYSDSAKAGLVQVQGYTQGRDVAIAGAVVDVVDQAKTLAVTIVFAVAILLAILFIMCSSWVEPFLFIATIGVAIVLNMGTNVVFPNVSETTFSIAAVLQLALSMDYSIMLTDRYRQERAATDNKVQAMVAAVKGGFSAISSSSLTTIAGMLCLVVMSFTIGRDMGLVLAKGVAFSILCVLFVLPGLMVACDTAIQKTKKPAPKPKLRLLAKLSYVLRYGILAVFVLLMAISFVVKGGASINFFMASSNPAEAAIDEAFGSPEQIVVLYDKSSAAASDAVGTLGDLDGVTNVQSYQATLGKPYTASELADEQGIDPALAELLYYAYANGTETGTMSVNEFARFIQDDVAGNPAFADALDADPLDRVGTLVTLSDASELEVQRSATDIAAVLGIDADQAAKLVLAYHLAQGDVAVEPVALADFTAFVEDDVAGDPTYASMLTDDEKAQVGRLAALTDTAAVTTPLDAAQLAEALAMDAAQVEQALQYQVFSTADISWYGLYIPQVLDALVDRVATNEAYAGSFDESTLAQLGQLRTLADATATGSAYTPAELAGLTGMDEATTGQLFALSGLLDGTGATPDAMTLPAFFALVIDGVANNPDVLATLDPALAAQLQQQAAQLAAARAVVDGTASGYASNSDDMAAQLGMDATLMRQVYIAAGLADGTLALPQMSVQAFLAYLLDTLSQVPQFQAGLDEAALGQLYHARALVDNAVAGTLYDVYGLAELLQMDPTQVQQLLVLRLFEQGGKDIWTAPLAVVVPLAAEQAQEAEKVDGGAAAGGSQAISDSAAAIPATEDEGAQLEMARQVVEGALASTTYTAAAMADLLGSTAPGLTEGNVALLYLYRESQTAGDPAQMLTLEQFVGYAADAVANDPLFAGAVDDTYAAELADAKAEVADAKGQLVGATLARAVITTDAARESAAMQDLVRQVRARMDAAGATYYLVGDGPMGLEMQEMFGGEFDFITWLTAIVIFLIVALTFRSAFVPLALVLLIQTAINLTMGLTALQGVGVYYIALMVVQALLMGATIDYAILFTTYYRESRETLDVHGSLARSYQGSVGTVMTSSSILVLVLLAVGFTSSDVTISEVCLTIAKGSFVAVTLVMLLLPGILAALDPLVAGPRRLRPGGAHSKGRDNRPPAPPSEGIVGGGVLMAWPEPADRASLPAMPPTGFTREPSNR